MTAWWDVWALLVADAALWAAARAPSPTAPATVRLRRYVADPGPPAPRGARRQGSATWPAGVVAAYRRMTPAARRRRAADQLACAALGWTPETLEALALASAAAFAAAAWAGMHLTGVPGPAWAWLAGAGIAGYRQPRAWVGRRGAAQVRAMEQDFPCALDVLVVGLRAGLSLPAAVAAYAEHGRGVAARAFRTYLADLAVGRTPEEGLSEMLRRYPSEAVAVAAAALAQSAQLGSPLADALEAQAAHLRRLTLRRAEESARSLAVKLMVPLLLCVFPQVFIVGLGPVALKLLGPGGMLR